MRLRKVSFEEVKEGPQSHPASRSQRKLFPLIGLPLMQTLPPLLSDSLIWQVSPGTALELLLTVHI